MGSNTGEELMAEPYRGVVEQDAIDEAAKIAKMIVDEETYEEDLRTHYRPELSYGELDDVTLTEIATDLINGEHSEAADKRYSFGDDETWTYKEFIDTCHEWSETVFDKNSDVRHLEMRGTTQAGDKELSWTEIKDNHHCFIQNQTEHNKDPSDNHMFLSITYVSKDYHLNMQESVFVEEMADKTETTEKTENPSKEFWPE